MAKRLLAAEEKHTEQEIQFLFPFGMTATEALWNEFDSSHHLLRAQSLMIIIVFFRIKGLIICRHKDDNSEMKLFRNFKCRINLNGLSFWFAFR